MRIKTGLLCIALLLPFFISSCSSINKTQKTAFLGSAAGGAIGAIVGKRAGNMAIGVTIGAALGATTGTYIGRRLDSLTAKRKERSPLYVINGVPYQGKHAHQRLTSITTDKIESVKILENAEAIALYGNRGENGAILIALKNQTIIPAL